MEDYLVKSLNNIDQGVLDRIPQGFNLSETDRPDAILLRSKDLHEMEFPENLKFIGRAGSGVNNIPLEKCSEKGIVVCNAPGANANGVKELVALSMIMASRNIAEALDWTKSLTADDSLKSQVESGKKAFVGPELYGKTVGVIGLGEIGALVANMCVDFGMKVYGYDPFITVKHAWEVNRLIERSNDLAFLFANCDIISLHIPYNKDTDRMVSRELLAGAKPGLCLINLARDGLVDYEALKEALDQDIISHYVVDFPDRHSLKLPKTINFPHLGASTPESEFNAGTMVVSSMVDYLKNGNIHNSVNFPDLDFGVCNSRQRLAVLHENIPNMIGQITQILAGLKINISRLSNKHKGNWAYTMIDLDDEISEDALALFRQITGVVRVRKLPARA